MVNLNNLCKNPNDIKEEIWKHREHNAYIILDVLGESCSREWYKYDSPEHRRIRHDCVNNSCSECRRIYYKELRTAFINNKRNNLEEW